MAVSFLGLLSPFAATLLGAAVLDQTFTAGQVLGVILALASPLAGQWPTNSAGQSAPPSPRTAKR